MYNCVSYIWQVELWKLYYTLGVREKYIKKVSLVQYGRYLLVIISLINLEQLKDSINGVIDKMLASNVVDRVRSQVQSNHTQYNWYLVLLL
jgi:tRNA A37 N6-isopentenylltransferase MiaA